jgi:hypothetical protein
LKIGSVQVIATRERSTMVSTWVEELCLEKISGTEFELFVGGYGVLAVASDFYNEDTEEEDIPNEIDGYPVKGVYDGVVVGGEIFKDERTGGVRFSEFDNPDVIGWLESVNWGDVDTMNATKSALNGSSKKGSLRDKVAKQYTATDPSKAQAMARECVERDYKGC